MVRIYIAGEEVTAENKFTIEEQILSTSSVILNKVYPKSATNYDDFYFPKDYSSCEIYINEILKFAGYVKNSGDITLNPYKPKYVTLQILDYKALLSEGKTLDYVIADKTVTQAITELIINIADYGFIEGNILITNDSTIGSYSTLNKSPYDILQYLSEISNTIWNTRVIDKDTIAIDFYDKENLPEATDIEYTTEYFEENGIDNITWSYGTRDYRNQQYIISDKVYASIDTTEIIVANGYDKTFIVEQPIGYVSDIKVDSVAMTVATNSEKDLGISADFYYTSTQNQFSSEETYTAGTTIEITYKALVQGREISQNNSEITRIQGQTGRNGIIARYENRNDIQSSEELQAIADTYMQYKGTPEIELTITTRDTDILNIGEKVYFNIPDLTDLQTDYLVKTKQTIIQTLDDSELLIKHIYKLSSNFNSESAINYFDNQRRKREGNIATGQYITRNIDYVSEATVVFDTEEIEELTATGNNGLNCRLNAPLIL